MPFILLAYFVRTGAVRTFKKHSSVHSSIDNIPGTCQVPGMTSVDYSQLARVKALRDKPKRCRI